MGRTASSEATRLETRLFIDADPGTVLYASPLGFRRGFGNRANIAVGALQ